MKLLVKWPQGRPKGGNRMNRADYTRLLDEIANEISEPKGTFQSRFGAKTEKDMEEIRYIAGIALFAADRFYSNLTRIDFEIRESEGMK